MVSDITLEKTLPKNLEAERSVIGAVLLDEKALYPASEHMTTEDLYLESHRRIWSRILNLAADGRAIDIVTLKNELQRHDELEQAGGPAYLAALTEGLPRAANVGHYANIVRECSTLRRLIQANNESMIRAYQAEEPAAAILEAHEAQIFDIASREVRGGFRSMDELVSVAYKEIELASNRKTALTGISSGLRGLDAMTSGFQPGDVTLIAARPSLGKTSLAMNVAKHAAMKEQRCVGVFSFESGAVEVTKLRLLASEAEIDIGKIKTGYLHKEDWAKLGRAAGVLSQARIYIDDRPGTIGQVRAKAHRLRNEHGLDLLIVDYLQLMVSERRRENRTQEVTEISRGLKSLARELEIPVIAISQLNRAPEYGGKNRRPQLSDLRESGALEQDADLVIFIYREELHNPTEDNAGIAELIIGKQRNGPTGSLNVVFLKQYCKFADMWQEGDDLPFR